MLRSESMPAQKRRSTHKKDAMTYEETETLLSPIAAQESLEHDNYDDDYDEDDSFCIEADTEPLTPTTPPIKHKLTYIPQFMPQLSTVSSANTAPPVSEPPKSLATPAPLTHSVSANSGLVRPPKMAFLKKKDRHKKMDHSNATNKKKLGSQPNTFDKSSSVEDSEGNLVPINPNLFQSDNGDVDNKSAMRLSNSGASNAGKSVLNTPRSPSEVAGSGEPNVLGLNTLGEEGSVAGSEDNIYAETPLDNEHLHMDGEYMSPVDMDGRNIGNIINNLDTVLKDNRLTFIDDFE